MDYLDGLGPLPRFLGEVGIIARIQPGIRPGSGLGTRLIHEFNPLGLETLLTSKILERNRQFHWKWTI